MFCSKKYIMENLPTIASMALGITATLSQAGINSRYKALLSLVVGIATSLLFYGLTKDAAMLGVIGGLTASGLWSGTKSLVKPDEPTLG